MSTESQSAIFEFRAKIEHFIEHRYFTAFITILILINAVTLGLETDRNVMASIGSQLHVLDRVILLVFTAELILKFYAYRLSFFKSGWNWFDLMIVGIAWIPASGNLSVMRALRVLRVLRLISVVPQMRRVISAIGHSIPGMISVVGVLGLIFYVSSVLATRLFGMHPDPNMQEWFGSISASAYTLFQIMTLESWSMGVVRPTMELFPWAWSFFLPFIIITSFAVLNFLSGLLSTRCRLHRNLKRKRKVSRVINRSPGRISMHYWLKLRHSKYSPETAKKKKDKVTDVSIGTSRSH